MTTKKLPFSATVGYSRLPSRTSVGSRAFYNKVYTKDARESMANIIRQISDLFKQTEARLPEVMLNALEPTFELSQVYCPVDTGELLGSGSLTVSDTSSGTSPRVQLSYGDNNRVPYAALVHEKTELNHAAPTRSKYVQAALEEDLPNILPRIQESLKVY